MKNKEEPKSMTSEMVHSLRIRLLDVSGPSRSRHKLRKATEENPKFKYKWRAHRPKASGKLTRIQREILAQMEGGVFYEQDNLSVKTHEGLWQMYLDGVLVMREPIKRYGEKEISYSKEELFIDAITAGEVPFKAFMVP